MAVFAVVCAIAAVDEAAAVVVDVAVIGPLVRSERTRRGTGSTTCMPGTMSRSPPAPPRRVIPAVQHHRVELYQGGGAFI